MIKKYAKACFIALSAYNTRRPFPSLGERYRLRLPRRDVIYIPETARESDLCLGKFGLRSAATAKLAQPLRYDGLERRDTPR
jgi:hypothetical protein